jgi:cytochrome c oxidase subunit 3
MTDASNQASREHDEAGSGDEEHLSPLHRQHAFLQHHYDSPEHQFEAGKLGMWIFLVTEVLFFSGLFCAYAVYRAQNPEVFHNAHFYLNTKLGAFNTIVLLLSSLSAAWAVRAVQLGQRRVLTASIAVTLLCAAGFLVIKYQEYGHKFHSGLLPGRHYAPTHQVWELESFRRQHPEAAEFARHLQTVSVSGDPKTSGERFRAELSRVAGRPEIIKPLLDVGVVGERSTGGLERLGGPKRGHVFFGIYFFMTGLHGVHVLAGILVWLWLLVRVTRGEFGPKYFGPVDYAALYWHLVDLVWIYLFPLLYLIH